MTMPSTAAPAALARVAYAFEADPTSQEGALSVHEGMTVVVLERSGEWVYVQETGGSGASGFVPSSYIEEMPAAAPPPPPPADPVKPAARGGLPPRRAATLYAALAVLILVVGLAAGLSGGGGGAAPPLSDAELRRRADAALDDALGELLEPAPGAGAAGNATAEPGSAAGTLVLRAGAASSPLGTGAIEALLAELGMPGAPELRAAVEVPPDPAAWAVGFPNRRALCPSPDEAALANGSAAPADRNDLTGLPVRAFAANVSLFNATSARALVTLFVGQLEAEPRVRVAVRVDLDDVAGAVRAVPAVRDTPAGTWLDRLALGAGGSVLVSTGRFTTGAFDLRRGVNVRVAATLNATAAAGLADGDDVVGDFVSRLDGTPRLELAGFFPLGAAAGVAAAAAGDDDDDGDAAAADDDDEPLARFDVLASDVTLPLPEGASATLDELSLRAEGLEVPPQRVEAAARIALGAGEDGTGDRAVFGAAGEWSAAASTLNWTVCSREVRLEAIAEYLEVDEVRGTVLMRVDSGNSRVERVEAEGDATLPPLNDSALQVYARFDGAVPAGGRAQVALLAAAELGDAATLADALCAFADLCDGDAADFVRNLDVDDMRLVASAATRAQEVRGTEVPRGVSVWGETSGVAVPSELASAAEILGLGPRPAAAVGFTLPPGAPLETHVFLAFGPGAVSVSDEASSDGGGVAGSDVVSISEVRAELRPLPVPAVSLGLTALVHGLDNDGPLAFTATASVTAAASVVLEGFLDGEWRDVGGLEGLHARDVGGSFGVSLGGVVTEVGLYGSFDFGPSTSAEFTVLLSAARGRFAVQANLTNLSVGSLVQFAEQVGGVSVPSAVTGALDALLQTDIRRLDLLVAPVAVEVGPRTIEQGFHARGEGRLLGVDFEVEVGQTSRRAEVAPGVHRDVPDFVVGFSVGGVGLGDLNAALRLADFLVDEMRREIDDSREFCCCGTIVTPDICASIPLGDVNGAIDRIVDGLNDLFEVREFALDEFSVSDMLMTRDREPELRFSATVAGRDVSLVQAVPVSFFALGAADAAEWIWNRVSREVPNIVETLAKQVMNRFCSVLNSLCVDIKVHHFCLKIPGVC